MARVVLVTGVSRYLGGRFAGVLTAQPGIERVIGVDVVPPPHDIGTADFVRADIRNPVIAKVIARAEVDTVVHMNVIATPTHAGGRVSMKEINVIGTMQLLAACQKAPTVRRLVVKSSAGVYGSSARDPALFTEDTAVEAMRLATAGSATGIVNVAGDGVLLVSQAARLAGRPILPVPPALSGAAGALLRRTGLTDFSREQMRFLSFGRALDTTRM